MARHFNTAGPCDPEKHFMLPPEGRVPGVRDLIARDAYFVIHAPRQVGKTTTFRALAQSLTAEGKYAALLASCETGQAARADVDQGVDAVLADLQRSASIHLPVELRPPAPDREKAPHGRLADVLSRWSQRSPRPVVLFLDEIDALLDDVLISVLRQLRAGYPDRPRAFPASLALIGLRDVRDYRVRAGSDAETLGTASPFNVKLESLTIRNFNADEVALLLDQHTDETGQPFTGAAKAAAFEMTGGQPWLVNALARQATEVLVRDRAVPITEATFEAARDVLILRRDTHLDSLIDRLREPRVRRIVAPILAGEMLPSDAIDDDVEFAKDLGLVRSGPRGLQIANPIYAEVIPRALTALMEESLALPRPSYVTHDRRLDFERVLDDFQSFWIEHADAFLARAPYSEAAAQLVFMAFLHKVVNGGGFVDREYAVGSGRVDLCVRWPRRNAPGERSGFDRWAVELKVWRDGKADPLAAGLEQLGGYLARLELDSGTLILFDARSAAAPLPARCARENVVRDGRRIHVIRL